MFRCFDLNTFSLLRKKNSNLGRLLFALICFFFVQTPLICAQDVQSKLVGSIKTNTKNQSWISKDSKFIGHWQFKEQFSFELKSNGEMTLAQYHLLPSETFEATKNLSKPMLLSGYWWTHQHSLCLFLAFSTKCYLGETITKNKTTYLKIKLMNQWVYLAKQ